MNKTIYTLLLTPLLLAQTESRGDGVPSASAAFPVPSILYCADADFPTRLAAHEVRRYLYLRTGSLAGLVSGAETPPDGDWIVVAAGGSPLARQVGFDATDFEGLAAGGYLLRTRDGGSGKVLAICGVDGMGTLYGAYHFAGLLGVRFHIDEDVLPDGRMEFSMPDLDVREEPLFARRGILPFNNFPEGPDWWDLCDYKAYLSQLAKMRMNFFGLHCYPGVPWGPEPTVWMGLPGDVNEDGTVSAAYQSSFHTTARLNAYGEESESTKRWWGYSPTRTSDFAAGASRLFHRDSHGPEVMRGLEFHEQTERDSIELFNRTGRKLRQVFDFARMLGIQSAVGTETPLAMPEELRARIAEVGLDPDSLEAANEVYRGMMKRLAVASPPDYYWAWSHESWLWPVSPEAIERAVAEFKMAEEAIRELDSPFQFATSGWVMGPVNDPVLFDRIFGPDVPIAAINLWLGSMRLQPGFDKIEGRPTWAIPWLEDDAAMIQPQLWVGRLRRDAADALEAGCDGLMGIHWRTSSIAPNFAKLAEAAWNQKPFEEPEPTDEETDAGDEGHEGGQVANYHHLTIEGSDMDPVFRTCRFGMDAYHISVPNGVYDVTLKFSEIHYREEGRRVFDVKVNGREAAVALDVVAEAGFAAAHEITVDDVSVTDGALRVDFAARVGEAFIAAIVIEGVTADVQQLEGEVFSRRINVGGEQWGNFEGDLGPRFVSPLRPGPRDLPADDFYRQWCEDMFGPEVAERVAAIFTSLDSGGPLVAHTFDDAHPRSMPMPSTWTDGPGAIRIDPRPWSEVRSEYDFVDRMRELRPEVSGSGRLARFDRWLNHFEYLKVMGEIASTRGGLDAVMAGVEAAENSEEAERLAREEALPAREHLARLWERMLTHLLAATETPGEFGVIANLEQHSRGTLSFLDLHDATLEKILGERLPERMAVAMEFAGEPRLVVPTKRGLLKTSEDFHLRAIVLDNSPPQRAVLLWRPLGQGAFRELPFRWVARGVHEVTLPAVDEDFEYRIEVETAEGNSLIFPATAPETHQSVVVISAE